MKTYTIRNNVKFLTKDGHLILQNDYGIIRITNQKMVEFLLEIEKEQLTNVSSAVIFTEFDNNTAEATDFLLKHGVIEERKVNNFNLENIIVSSNDEKVGSTLEQFLEAGTYLSFKDFEGINEFKGNTLCLIFLNPYSRKLAKKIRDKFLEREDCLLMISYLYNNNLYIDSPYSSKWKSPCHICQIGLIESELRNSDENHNYQSFIDELYTLESEFQVELPLSKIQHLNISTEILNRLDKFMGRNKYNTISNRELYRGLVMNITTNEIRLDTTIHWEYCDCYE
ncbi:McbB family protein [Peribacillus sp. SCS-26]|uniref:McbB family protein n=1 Tax=Paraperibacillus marinus TaxID=3115295 RepID=UPI003905823D